VRDTGARYRSYRNAFLADLQALPDRLEQVAWLLMRTAGEVLAADLDSFRSEHPDYVITDSMAPWGQWVGRILGVPVVTSVSTLALNRHVIVFGMKYGVRPRSLTLLLSKIRHMAKAARLRWQLCRRYGVDGPGVLESVVGHSNLNIVYTSRHFQACAETFDDRFIFIGPSLPPDVAMTRPSPSAGRPLVYVSMGSLFQADASFYREVFAAFEHEEVDVLISAGPRASDRALAAPPSNIDVQAFLPQLEILRQATVFVTHGGMNSVSEGLWSGVPLVVIPFTSEQAMIGRRVEELGAGLYLDRTDASAARLGQAVRRVLGDAGFRQRAGVVRESFDSAGGVGRAVDAIATYVGA
jgi:MGT family glycosyltransferase